MKYSKFLILLLMSLLFLFGCAQKEVSKCTLTEDNPEHHYLTGMKALEQGNYELAQEKFERAIYCDENFSKAYSGLAIAKSEKG